MDIRLFTLAIPTALIFAGLVWHSRTAMPRRRAIAFWLAVLAYGVLRGFGVRAVTDAIGASFPYEIRDPIFSIGGISVQEMAGWAVVSYLAWWIGWRFSQRSRRPWLFLQVAWGAIFLGGISWAIEAAAIAARWWHWTVPTASSVFLNVPAIGIVDWFFVGIDFLLPFAAITAPALAASRWRFLTLLFFPAHFGGHLLPGIWLHVVHWLLVLVALALALRSDVEDEPFEERGSRIPSAGFGLIVLDLVLVDLFVAGRPELIPSTAPVLVVWLVAIKPAVAGGVASASLLAALRFPSMLVATAVAVGATLLLWLRRKRMVVPALAAVLLIAFTLHYRNATKREDLTERLDSAIAVRDLGEIDRAVSLFEAIARDHPTTHVPLAMAAEIDYRRSRPSSAREKLIRAVETKQDFVRGYRLLAVIDLQAGRRDDGRAWARRGLEIDGDDLQLRYLAGEDVSGEIDSPDTAAGMAALAFEIDDVDGARQVISRAVLRWPADDRLRRIEARLANGQSQTAEYGSPVQ